MVDLVKQHLRTGHTWIASFASLVALAFSGYNFAQLQEDPRPVVTLPLTLKLWRDGEKTSVFLQPAVYTRFSTEDAEIITDVRLALRATHGGPEPKFFWEDNVRFTASHDPKSYDDITIWWEFESDPAPFIVSQTQPQRPALQFSTLGWQLTPGRYDGTLTLRRASTHAPIERSFCLLLNAEAIKRVSRGNRYYDFRTDVPGRSQGGCYQLYLG
ncbi:hypothetical protein [Streptomyces sp. NBC_01276]|uniref:hypothetical protein n=1 Tax=Streptomyces sp. NBC_01276 TaxID=2903808 RepID=UPI00352C0677